MRAYPLRFLFATRPAVLTQVLGIVYRAVSTFLVRGAGLRVGAGARTGAVTLIQRFGSTLNLNVHLHMLFVDGVYTFEGERPRFDRQRPHRYSHNNVDRRVDGLYYLLSSGQCRHRTRYQGESGSVTYRPACLLLAGRTPDRPRR